MQTITGEWEYFPSELIELNRNNVLVSPCGTGKTEALKTWLKANETKTVVAITFRRSLAHMLSKAYGFENYMHIKDERKISIHQYPRTVISVESLGRFCENSFGESQLVLPQVLILDEYVSILEHAFNAKTLDAYRRLLFFSFVSAMLKDPNRTVIMADAYFQLDIDLEVFEELNALDPAHKLEKYRICVNEKLRPEKLIRVWCSREKWRDHLKATFEDSSDKKNLFLFSNCKKVLDGLQFELSGASLNKYTDTNYPVLSDERVLYLSSDSSPRMVEESSLDPESIWAEYKLVSITPVISAGISFAKPHFHKAYGYAALNSTSPLGFLQQLHRVRNLSDNEIELLVVKQNKPKTFNYPSREVVVEFLEQRNAIFMEKFARCLETNIIEDVTNGKLILHLNQKSIVNVFCIRVCRAFFFAKNNYLGYLRRLCDVDNFKLEILDAKESKKILDDKRKSTYKEWELMTTEMRDNLKSTSFATTLNRSENYKVNSLFGFWDGILRMSTLASGPKCSSAMSSFIAFLEKWNALGSFGLPSELIDLEKPIENRLFAKTYSGDIPIPRRLEKTLKLSPENCGHFYVTFVEQEDKQELFYQFICQEYLKTITADRRENLIGNNYSVLSAAQYYLMLELFQAVDISPFLVNNYSNWLGSLISIRTGFKVTSTNDVIFDTPLRGDEPVEQLPYIIHSARLTASVSSPFFMFNEAILNSAVVAIRVQKLLQNHWSVVYTDFLASKQTGYSCNKPPSCLTENLVSCPLAVLKEFFRLARDAVSIALSKIGIEYGEATSSRLALFDRPNQRYRFNSYPLHNFSERLMLCYCREILSYRQQWKEIHHHPVADPFGLLRRNPKEVAMLFRYRYRRDLWEKPEMTIGTERTPSTRVIDYWYHQRNKMRAIMKPESIAKMRERNFISDDKDAYDSMLVNLKNIRYYWFILKMGTNNPVSLRTSIYTKKFVDIEPMRMHKYLPYKKTLAENETPFVVLPTDTDWRETETYRHSRRSMWEYYDLEAPLFYEGFERLIFHELY